MELSLLKTSSQNRSLSLKLCHILLTAALKSGHHPWHQHLCSLFTIDPLELCAVRWGEFILLLSFWICFSFFNGGYQWSESPVPKILMTDKSFSQYLNAIDAAWWNSGKWNQTWRSFCMPTLLALVLAATVSQWRSTRRVITCPASCTTCRGLMEHEGRPARR